MTTRINQHGTRPFTALARIYGTEPCYCHLTPSTSTDNQEAQSKLLLLLVILFSKLRSLHFQLTIFYALLEFEKRKRSVCTNYLEFEPLLTTGPLSCIFIKHLGPNQIKTDQIVFPEHSCSFSPNCHNPNTLCTSVDSDVAFILPASKTRAQVSQYVFLDVTDTSPAVQQPTSVPIPKTGSTCFCQTRLIGGVIFSTSFSAKFFITV